MKENFVIITQTNSFSLPFAYELKHLNNDTFKSNTSVEVFKENGVSATNVSSVFIFFLM